MVAGHVQSQANEHSLSRKLMLIDIDTKQAEYANCGEPVESSKWLNGFEMFRLYTGRRLSISLSA